MILFFIIFLDQACTVTSKLIGCQYQGWCGWGLLVTVTGVASEIEVKEANAFMTRNGERYHKWIHSLRGSAAAQSLYIPNSTTISLAKNFAFQGRR